jgi:hypothetical protein
MSAVLGIPPSHPISLVVTHELAQDLGITNKENEVWRELEMSPHSVIVHCRT